MRAVPLQFADPAAEETEWMPLADDNASLTPRKLVIIGQERMEFRAAAGMVMFFSFILILVGAGFAAIDVLFSKQPALFIAFGLTCMSAGGVMWYFITMPVIFDKQKGFFWKGRKVPVENRNWRECKDCVRLGEINAIQLIAGRVSGENSADCSYEINLALKNGSRINVVVHGNKKKVQEYAKALAEFLGKPLWDASEMNILDKKRFKEICKRAKEHPELLDEETRRKLEVLKERFKVEY